MTDKDKMPDEIYVTDRLAISDYIEGRSDRTKYIRADLVQADKATLEHEVEQLRIDIEFLKSHNTTPDDKAVAEAIEGLNKKFPFFGNDPELRALFYPLIQVALRSRHAPRSEGEDIKERPCLSCETKGKIIYGHNMGETVWHECPDCEGVGKILKAAQFPVTRSDVELTKRIVGWLETLINLSGVDPDTTEITVEVEKGRTQVFNMADDIEEIKEILEEQSSREGK